jgi:hypothetical protein
MEYIVQPRAFAYLSREWDDPVWSSIPALEVAAFRPESSDHRPRTLARLAYTPDALWGIFRVADRYVRCTHVGYGAEVWKDSCVEIFVQPIAGAGYMNFEFNCGGSFLCSHVIDPTRTDAGGLADARPLPVETAAQVSVTASLPRVVEPETSRPVVWTLAFRIPIGVLEACVGSIDNPAGQTWRGNLYKCAEEVSHPHWAAWSPVDALNFHLPACFGGLTFAR